MKFTIWSTFKGISFVGISLSLILALSGCKESNAGQPQQAEPEVSVVAVAPERIVTTTELPGRPSAFRMAEIRPQVNGIIQKRLFEEGSDVTAGQVLYQIDPAPFQAAFDNAKAALEKAEAGLFSIRLRVERYKDLLADKAVSQQDYDDATAALKQAEADIQYWKASAETAAINLAYTKVTAPISGRIGKSNVTDGALVAAYQPTALATIQQLDPIYVDVPQSTTEMLRLKEGFENGRLNQDGHNQNKVKLIMENGKIYPSEGKLQFRDVTVDPTTGSVILRIVFPNPDSVLLPGMFVRAQIIEGVHNEAIMIPQQSVFRDVKGNPVTMVVNPENKVEAKLLTLDRAIGNKWLVSSGIKKGELVIVEGLQKVRPGASVKVIQPGTSPESEPKATKVVSGDK
jgi:membrane fusion protein (multidrug efflux system)